MISSFVSLLRISVKDNTCVMLYLDSTVLDVQKLEMQRNPSSAIRSRNSEEHTIVELPPMRHLPWFRAFLALLDGTPDPDSTSLLPHFLNVKV